jgi:CDP-glucose 4,6-dehydratase
MGKDYSLAMQNPLGQRLRELPGSLLLTGHTGFKGTWMTFLLEHLSVPVVGYSLPAEIDSLYDRAKRIGAIPEAFGDIRDYAALEQFIDLHKPSTIIHMAAQPLVLKSYEDPRETFDVNVMGTVNVLDIAFKKDFVKAIVVVTTDKVYRNDNSGRAFVESDPLEGKDPYSASKVGTEAVIAAWRQIANVSGGPRVVSVRGGNVIGGGDFAKDRIIPDLIRGIMNEKNVIVRNPNSTRPWQHVLDPLVGYLSAIEESLVGRTPGELNFGPENLDVPVSKLIEVGQKIFPGMQYLIETSQSNAIIFEAEKLQLNSNKSMEILNWSPKWDSIEAIELTFKWWDRYINHRDGIAELCKGDILKYFEIDLI